MNDSGDRGAPLQRTISSASLSGRSHIDSPGTSRSKRGSGGESKYGEEKIEPSTEFLCERTVCARVVADRVDDRVSSGGSVSRGGEEKDSASVASSRAGSVWRNRFIAMEVVWSTVSKKHASKEAHVAGLKIWRRERDLFKFETFRRKWVDEQLRWPEEEERRLKSEIY